MSSHCDSPPVWFVVIVAFPLIISDVIVSVGGGWASVGVGLSARRSMLRSIHSDLKTEACDCDIQWHSILFQSCDQDFSPVIKISPKINTQDMDS